MYLYELSKENLELSRYEADRTAQQDSLHHNFLEMKNPGDYTRLAMTKRVFEVICQGTKENILERIARCRRLCAGSFSVRSVNTTGAPSLPTEKEAAAAVWKNLENPRVVLKNPDTKYFLIRTPEKVFFSTLIWENKEDWRARRAHNRPEPHPTSLDPRMARAFINILGAKTVMDPFCGAGGILIEAGLAGCKVIGYDIDPIMVRRARINLEHYNIKEYFLEVKDALSLDHAVEGIITDLPYGRNSKLIDMQSTYARFMQKCRQLTHRMIVMFPDTIDPSIFCKGWIVEASFKVYLHKSLSKKILVLTC